MRFLYGLLMLFSTACLAAPQQVKLVYEVTRNGQPFATVTETFQQQDSHYQIESLTEGKGVYALFGKRRLSSEGEVTAQGLRPLHFALQQGDKKPVDADFDWAAGTLTMQSTAKAKSQTAQLEEGTQDLLSYAYQFMFRPPQGDEITVPVTTGKKLRAYQYRVVEKEVSADTPAGAFKTLHLANHSPTGDESKELWLGVDKNYVVVRRSMKDENGAQIEQTLSSLHVK